MFRSKLFSKYGIFFKRYAHSDTLQLSSLIKHMVTQKTPEVIYTYKPPRLVKIGSWALTLTFVTYGATFCDWAFLTNTLDEPIDSAKADILQAEKEINGVEDSLSDTKRHPIALKMENIYREYLNTPTNRYFIANGGIVLLTAIPFVLALSAWYFPSRIITKMKFFALNQQIEVTTLYNSKKILDIPKCEIRGKLYTGLGPQLCDDKGSFNVFLLNNANVYNTLKKKKITFNWIKNLYIISRSGHFYRDDARFVDVLFKKREILEEASKLNRYKVHKTVDSESSQAPLTTSNDLQKNVQTMNSLNKKTSIPKPIAKNSNPKSFKKKSHNKKH